MTIDGRIPLTGGNEGIASLRQVNLDVLPTEVISGMLACKTQTAELVETGIAGEIDVQTLQPLDYHLQAAASPSAASRCAPIMTIRPRTLPRA